MVLVPLYFGVPFAILMTLAVLGAGGYGFMLMVPVFAWFALGAVVAWAVLALAWNKPWKGPCVDAAVASGIGITLSSILLLTFVLVMTSWGGWG